MHTIYSKHVVTDGRWEVSVWIKEEPEHLEIRDKRQDIRVLLDRLYNSEANIIASTILDEVMDAEKVEVSPLYGPTIIAIRGK